MPGIKDRKYSLIVRDADDTTTLCTLSGSEIIDGNVIDELNAEQTLTFTMDRTASDFSDIAIKNIIRLNNTETSTYVTYRIKDIREYRRSLRLKVEVYCEHLKYDLADIIVKERIQFVQQTPTTILNNSVLKYATDFSLGEIKPKFAIDFDIEYESCLEIIQRLAEVTNYDYEIIADGGANHKKIYIRTINNTTNGTPGTAAIEFKKNLRAVSHESKISEGFATRIIAIGGEAEPAQRWAYKNAISGDILNVKYAAFVANSYDSGTGWINVNSERLLTRDDALNGYYALIINGSPTDLIKEILDCDKQNGYDRIKIATGQSVPNDSVFYILDKDGTTAIDFVPDNVSENSYDVTEKVYVDESLSEVYNLAGPEDYSDLSGTYSNGICQGWSKIGSPTVSENTTSSHIKNGSKSQKVIAGDGEGIYRNIYLHNNEPYSFYAWIKITSIASGAKLVIRQKISDSEYFPINAETEEDECYLEETGWYQVIAEGAVAGATGDYPFEIFADGGSVTFYLDSVVIVLSEYMPMIDAFVPHCSRKMLWERAIEQLRNINKPKISYDVKFYDLYEYNSGTYSSDEFKVGDSLSLVDSGLNINTTIRCIKKSWNLLKPWICKGEFETS